MEYKKNVAIQLVYRSLNYVTGLTDLQAKVYDEVGVLFSTVTLTEVVGQGGLYVGSFTPDEVGQWRVRISSITNLDDVTKVFEIQLYNDDDIKSQTQSIEDKLDIIDGNVNLIKIETDKIPDIKTETDKIQTIDDNVDYIKSKVDTIDTKVSRGGYFCN